MAPKAPAANIDNAIRDYLAGESCEVSARRHHTSEARLGAVLRERDLWRTTAEQNAIRGAKIKAAQIRRIQLPDDAIVARYRAGESENAIAQSLGVSRSVIRRRLVEAGIPPRGRLDANRLMMSARTPEEHRRNTRAANIAATGRKATLQERCKYAQTKERLGGHDAAAESLLADMLLDRGVETIPQKAIGPYNVDLAAGPVAVEVFGGGWHASGRHAARAPQRFRYLLDEQWAFVVVWVDGRHWPLLPAAADYIVSFVEFTRSDPSACREYRVIRGDGQFVARGKADDDELTVVMPSRSANRRA